MNTDNTPIQTPLVFTEAAANKVQELISEEGDPNLSLRASIRGGGCKGFEYAFSFDDQIAETDTVITTNAVRLLIDKTSIMYLAGATIDYREGLSGSEFVIKNPNAKQTCSCGSSFTADNGTAH